MTITFNIIIIFRLLIGLLFIVSGFEKLIGPYQNFLFVIQSYEILPAWGEEIVARVFPWIEFLIGIFMVLGFWLQWAVPSTMVMLFFFIAVIGQAIIRGLPIDECGCFGSMISFPLNVIILFDSFLLILTGVLLRKREAARVFSLDGYFDE